MISRKKEELAIKTFHSNCPHVIGGSQEEEFRALRAGYRLCFKRDLERYSKMAAAVGVLISKETK